MITNYFKVVFRNIIKNKSYSIINIFGLAVGLASCIIIYLFISYETSFDKFYAKSGRIYIVGVEEKHASGIQHSLGTQFPFAEAMRTDFPELEAVSRIYGLQETQVKVEDELFNENNFLFTEPDFFKMFDVEYILGDPENNLEDPQSIIITEELAKKYFENESPIGKNIKLDNTLDLSVVAVIKSTPNNTSLPYNAIASVNALTEDYLGMDMNRWTVTSGSNATFILLPDNTSPESVVNGFESFKKKYLRERDVEINTYSLIPLTELHNNTLYSYMTYTTGGETIFIFGIIGFVILIIASINFVNLSIAQSVKRSKEVGIRKTLGAFRGQLVKQYLGESLQYNFIAIVLAISLVLALLPELNNFLGNGTDLNLFSSIYVPIFLLSTFILVGLITGIYPALILSRFNPVKMFKTDFSNTKKGFFSLRNSLVGIQFIISQILIVSVFVIASQLDLIKNKDLGFTKDSIVNVQLPEPDISKMEVLRTKLLSSPNIKAVSFELGPPTSNALVQSFAQFDINGELKNEIVKIQPVDENYINLFDIKLLAGSNFSRYVEGDTLYKYIINESMLKQMNIVNPDEAIGKPISVSRYRGEIIGVVIDFHQQSLREEITPLVMTNFITDFFENTSIKMSANNIPTQIEYIKNSFAEIFPGYIHNVEFYDEFLGQLYESEERIFTIIESFAILAIIIGCLGLFGLMSFIAVQKTKEIGIRKVLGATIPNILSNLSKQFSKVIIISNVIAWPMAYFVMSKWLEGFAYRTEINVSIFIISGVIGLAIAILSISFQAVKAALANPGESLKYE